jgi:hypothetical protein
MKTGSNLVENHPQLSHNRHLVDNALVGASLLCPIIFYKINTHVVD